MARQAFERALALAPESPRVLFATGFYHYYVEQDFDAALDKFLAAAEALPNDADILAATAYVWRRQGRFEEGIERLERAFELDPRTSQHPALIGEYAQQPVEKEAYIGPYLVENLAVIYAWVGERDRAIDQLDLLLSIPAKFSVEKLRLDPRWDSLRDHPRFGELTDTSPQAGRRGRRRALMPPGRAGGPGSGGRPAAAPPSSRCPRPR